MSVLAAPDLPPPPPPAGFGTGREAEEQRAVYQLLHDLGYPVENASIWTLIATLVQDLAQAKDSEVQVRASLRKAEQDKRRMVLELARKINQESDEENDEGENVGAREHSVPRSRAVSDLSARNSRLERELAQTRAALQEAQSECQRLASIASFASSKTEAATSERTAEQKKLADAQRAIDGLSRKLEEEKQRARSLEDELDRSKLEVVKQESNRDALNRKLERTSQAVASAEEAKRVAEETLTRSREETRTQMELVLEERRSKRAMKVRLEELAKELDGLRTEVSKLDRAKTALERTNIDLEQTSGVLKRQLSAQSEALSGRDEELRELKVKLQNAEKQLAEQEKVHGLRVHEIRAAAQDVANMTRENRELNRAVERYAQETRQHKAALEQTNAKVARLEGMLDAAKTERVEMLASIRRLNEDKIRLADELRALTDAKSDLVREERLASDEAAELTRRVAELEGLSRRLQSDLDAAERRAEGLGRELRAARSRAEALEESKTLAERTSGTEQQRYAQASRQYESVRRELEQTRTELGICAGRLEKAMQENARLAEQLVGERLKVTDLEHQVERARIAQAKALIASGQAAVESSTAGVRQALDSASRVTTRTDLEDEPSSASSGLRDFNEQFEELERVMGGGGIDESLSEASSIIRQAREDRLRREAGSRSGAATPGSL